MVAGGELTGVAYPASRRRRRHRLRRLGQLLYVVAGLLVVTGAVVTLRRDDGGAQSVAARTPTSRALAVTTTTEAPPPANNTAPVITGPRTATISASGSSALPAISIDDREARQGDAFGVLLYSTTGRITLTTESGLGFFSPNGGYWVPFAGSIGAVRAAMAGVRFTPDPGKSNYSVTIVATDYGHHGRYGLLASQSVLFLQVGH